MVFPLEFRHGWTRKNECLPFHTDGKLNETNCYQSWVTALDVNEDDATLGILEKSHLHYDEFNEKYNIRGGNDWYKVMNHSVFNDLTQICPVKRIACPAGSLVIWNSKLMHTALKPLKGRQIPNYRCVFYLCYLPRSMSDRKNIKKKIDGFEKLRMTSHNPAKIYFNPKTPRTYGAIPTDINVIDAPVLTPLGKRLCGYDE
jgi:hypothetical protein